MVLLRAFKVLYFLGLLKYSASQGFQSDELQESVHCAHRKKIFELVYILVLAEGRSRGSCLS